MSDLYDPEGKLVKVLRPFADHGVDFTRTVGTDQALGICPFSGKEKFYVNLKNGLWDCKSKDFQESGNLYTFLEHIAVKTAEETSLTDYRKFSKFKGIPVSILKRHQVGWSGSHWTVPIRNRKGTVIDIRKCRTKGKLVSTSGCNVGLFNLENLKRIPKDLWVYLCEGEWDAMALEAWLEDIGEKAAILAVPGAGTFKDVWGDFFSGRKVRVCYDADEAGDNGMEKVAGKLRTVAKTLEFINWPETLPSGYDLRDFFSQEREPRDFYTLFSPSTRRKVSEEVETEEIEHDEPGRVKTWEALERTFHHNFKMDENLVSALKLAMATAVTVWMEGDPLWMFLVSPPGDMKTEILMSLSESEWATCKSSLTPKSLVSGYKSAEDPSLIPRLDGSVFVLKDYTEICTLHPNAQEEIYGILRGAFDGFVERDFGNGQVRSYESHFNILAGATHVIHGNRRASLGERFLKFCIHKGVGGNSDDAIRAALSNVGRETRIKEEVKEAVRSFLAQKWQEWQRKRTKVMALVKEDTKERIVAMARLLAMLRAEVERDNKSEALLYRPQHEIGTRPAKQLMKLAMGLAFISGRHTVGRAEEEMVRRVTFDTAIGFHIDLVSHLSTLKEGATIDDLAKSVRIPKSTLYTRMDDLLWLGVVEFRQESEEEKGNRTGPHKKFWKLTKVMTELWNRSRLPLLIKKGEVI